MVGTSFACIGKGIQILDGPEGWEARRNAEEAWCQRCPLPQYLPLCKHAPAAESYIEDIEACDEAAQLGRSPAEVYQALCSGAESGWDFSTRWLKDGIGKDLL